MIMKYDLPVATNFKKSRSAGSLHKEHHEKPTNNGHNIDCSHTWDFHDTQPSSCEGYMYVQNRSFWRLPKHAWKKKYFTLRSDSLYMTDTQTDTPKHNNCIKIGIDTGIYPRDQVTDTDTPKYYIRITTGKHNYTLRSTEEDDRNTWITSLLMSMSNTLLGRATAKSTPSGTPTRTPTSTPTSTAPSSPASSVPSTPTSSPPSTPTSSPPSTPSPLCQDDEVDD